MNTMPGDPHAQIAAMTDRAVEDWMTHEGVTDATMLAAVIDRQAEATLALAFEVRTVALLLASSMAGTAESADDQYGEAMRRMGATDDQ